MQPGIKICKNLKYAFTNILYFLLTYIERHILESLYLYNIMYCYSNDFFFSKCFSIQVLDYLCGYNIIRPLSQGLKKNILYQN